ncbi:endonuclease/exonuclease/phosphatase family protein [Micromonospora polyrhachis]|uniref:Endonuclease/exonuclease/phosphatase family metal-dependent hydrolase n=1 Tax=Micromonospora polyrhachis TaxID=1282883 RepID=A0A7W7WMA9_9ACTN|nr:endonuclease/exonuclease/phosphatase family protein [Micromonospora polyrhachis]MBB4956971.1 endonuclease/exonuclease/phosphatase family metal-dependent hydrolase [Micromonospora polyrhachis]
MTWNIWWRFGPRWRDRQPGIRTTLERFRPDVVALQEVWAGDGTTQAHELAAVLGMHAAFVSPSYPPVPRNPEEADWVGIDLGIAVLSRWPILDEEAAVMPARHRTWNPVALSVRVDHPAGPLPIVAACLDYGVPYTDDRIAQGAFIAGLATDPRFDGPCPVLLMGDLNAAVDSPVLRPVRDVLTDAWSAGGGPPDAITLPSTHPSAPLAAGPQMVDQRIDHIFFRPGREDQQVLVEGVQLAGEPVSGVHPSDHRAVVADLRWHG